MSLSMRIYRPTYVSDIFVLENFQYDNFLYKFFILINIRNTLL